MRVTLRQLRQIDHVLAHSLEGDPIETSFAADLASRAEEQADIEEGVFAAIAADEIYSDDDLDFELQALLYAGRDGRA